MQRVSFGQSYQNKPLVLATGLFDAVHRGHAALLEKTALLAKERGAVPAVFTLSGCKGAPLFTEEERAYFLSRTGIEMMIVAPFEEVKGLEGREFLTRLFSCYRVAAVVCGEDYRFGSGASCGVRELAAFCFDKSADVEIVPAVTDENGNKISTTAVKNALYAGDLAAAKNLLGRNYSITGAVKSGYQIGRTLGFPTANIDLSDRFLPKTGVYAVRAALRGNEVAADAENRAALRGNEIFADEGRGFPAGGKPADAVHVYYGIANLGAAPTVGHEKVLLEVHFDGFTGDLYGQTITVEFLSFLREIKKFDGIDALSAQLAEDLARLRTIADAK